MKRFIFLCLASISLLSSCDFAPDVYNPLTSRFDKPDLDVTVNGATAIVRFSWARVLSHDYENSVGVCWDTTPKPSLHNSFHKELKYEAGSEHFIFLDNLQENTTYYLRTYLSNPGSIIYGYDITFTTKSEYVDLGLSVKWGTSNVGASNENLYGQYFAWGEIDSKEEYNGKTYKWKSNAIYDIGSYTKYVTDSKYAYSTIDNKTVLDLEDDAAYVHLNHKAQIPTKEQWEELISSCDWKWEQQNNISGYRVTSKTNKNSIFLPALGYMDDDDKESYNCCYYWSKSLNITSNLSAWCFYGERIHYTSGNVVYTYKLYNWSRPYGLPIRAVYE